MSLHKIYSYMLLTKSEVKMVGYWPSSFFCIMDLTEQAWSREFVFSWSNHYRIHCIAKDFTFIRIQNGLIILRADSESQLCLQHNKPWRVIYFFSMYMPTLSKSYKLCKFSCMRSIWGIPSRRGW